MYNYTFGAELELADVDTRLELPPGNTWCMKDGSICNSNGTANDPLKKFNKFGSEIQTRVCFSPEELLEEVAKIYRVLNVDDHCFNYTTNLHVHIGFPELKTDLQLLKNILEYAVNHSSYIFRNIEPVPEPLKSDYSDPDEFTAAMKRCKRRRRSHQHHYEAKAVDRMLGATTVEEFINAMAIKDRNGKPQWHLFTRPGINLESIRNTGTIEFRHFTMSPDLYKMECAFRWPKLFVEGVLNGKDASQLFGVHMEFQQFYPFCPQMDKIFQQTNVYHNSRKVVRENYRSLIQNGTLTLRELGITEL